MFTVKQTPEFERWINGLKDSSVRLRLARRLDKAQRGILGDVAPVGEGVSEMREHFGPGWRMYFIRQGDVLILMLGGGDKSSQSADIAKALALAKSHGGVTP
jgi:putative addiction module killer protein